MHGGQQQAKLNEIQNSSAWIGCSGRIHLDQNRRVQRLGSWTPLRSNFQLGKFSIFPSQTTIFNSTHLSFYNSNFTLKQNWVELVHRIRAHRAPDHTQYIGDFNNFIHVDTTWWCTLVQMMSTAIDELFSLSLSLSRTKQHDELYLHFLALALCSPYVAATAALWQFSTNRTKPYLILECCSQIE